MRTICMALWWGINVFRCSAWWLPAAGVNDRPRLRPIYGGQGALFEVPATALSHGVIGSDNAAGPAVVQSARAAETQNSIGASATDTYRVFCLCTAIPNGVGILGVQLLLTAYGDTTSPLPAT